MSRLMLLALAALALGTSHAEEITFVASGQVTWITPGGETLGGRLANAVHVRDDVRFYYTFESTTPAWQPYASPAYLIYARESMGILGVKRARIEVAGNVWEFAPCGAPVYCSGRIVIHDDYFTGQFYMDLYRVDAVDRDPVSGALYQVLMDMASYGDATPVLPLGSTNLPLTPPDVAAFQEAHIRLSTTGMQIDVGKVTSLVKAPLDTDGDGITDVLDNCLLAANPGQTDTDSDGLGDVCDNDDDNDGVLDSADNCRLVANADQANADGDEFGNACDGDIDGDTVDNADDNCPLAVNPDQTNSDRDREGDECDANDDNDAHPDASDNCPAVPNDGQGDLDQDGIGDVCDADLDGDGIVNTIDNCPIDANGSQDDTDNDGAGDACDDDDDADTVVDGADNCPLVPNLNQVDTDGDHAGDACDGDLDGDNVANAVDNCPTVANSGQADVDADGIGDSCDVDIDGDGIGNTSDACGLTPADTKVNSDGCALAQLCPCEGPNGTIMPWRNHGKYVSCIAQMANRFLAEGLISSAEHSQLVSDAARSECGGVR